MQTIGEVLSNLFDERFTEEAQGYSKLYESWIDITKKNGIAAAIDHSKIKDLNKGVLSIEVDHPGWKQILQTKQSKLLYDFSYRFPKLKITGLSLILGNCSRKSNSEEKNEKGLIAENNEIKSPEKINHKGIESINDDNFKESLKKLGQSIEPFPKLSQSIN